MSEVLNQPPNSMPNQQVNHGSAPEARLGSLDDIRQIAGIVLGVGAVSASIAINSLSMTGGGRRKASKQAAKEIINTLDTPAPDYNPLRGWSAQRTTKLGPATTPGTLGQVGMAGDLPERKSNTLGRPSIEHSSRPASMRANLRRDKIIKKQIELDRINETYGFDLADEMSFGQLAFDEDLSVRQKSRIMITKARAGGIHPPVIGNRLGLKRSQEKTRLKLEKQAGYVEKTRTKAAKAAGRTAVRAILAVNTQGLKADRAIAHQFHKITKRS